MSQEKITDALIRHQIFLHRYGNSQNRKAQKELLRILAAIKVEILSDSTQNMRKDFLFDMFDQVAQIAFSGAEDLLAPEAVFAGNVLTASGAEVGAAISATQLVAAFNEEVADLITGKAIQKLTPSKMVSVFNESKSEEILRIWRDGRLSGKTNADIVKEIDQLTTRTKRQVETLVRTLTNQAASVARTERYKLSGIDFEEYVSVLDSRTTVICGSLDGEVFEVGKGVQTPRHYNSCVAGTKIKTKRGDVNIEDVRVGDYVLTHKNRYRKVTTVMSKNYDGLATKLKDSFGKWHTFTNDHPVLTNLGYQAIGDIKAGFKIFNCAKQFTKLNCFRVRFFVADAVLIDSHNIKTKATEKLVAYEISSSAAKVSSAIKLNNSIADNKIRNIFTYWNLKLKRIIGLR